MSEKEKKEETQEKGRKKKRWLEMVKWDRKREKRVGLKEREIRKTEWQTGRVTDRHSDRKTE